MGELFPLESRLLIVYFALGFIDTSVDESVDNRVTQSCVAGLQKVFFCLIDDLYLISFSLCKAFN